MAPILFGAAAGRQPRDPRRRFWENPH